MLTWSLRLLSHVCSQNVLRSLQMQGTERHTRVERPVEFFEPIGTVSTRNHLDVHASKAGSAVDGRYA